MSALPEAFSVHRTGTRVRLRVPERRGDEAFFASVERAFSGAPGVRAVRVDPRTASVLVRHEGDLERLAEHAARARLFAWRPEPSGDVLVELREHLRAADASLHARTAGRWSLDALAFYALLGAGAYQIAQGVVLPAGLALLTKALAIVERRDDDE